MDGDIKIELQLDGLNCAHCASKIEKKVGEISKVKKIFLNFASKTMTIEADKADMDEILKETKKIVKNIEPDVIVKEKNTIKSEIKNNKNIIKNIFIILASIILLFTANFLNAAFIVKFIIYTISYLLVGWDVIYKAIKNAFKGRVFDENFLMGIATIGAFSINQYQEAVSVMLFYKIGEFFQSLAVDKSRKSIEELMDIRPDFANKICEDDIIRVSPMEIKAGDLIMIKPGEKIPMDGVVIDGTSMLDTSALTGESLLKDAAPGSTVLGGFINRNGILKVKVTKEYRESAAAKILDMVENAANKKAQSENFISKFAKFYTPAVVAGALLIAVIPYILTGGTDFSKWLYRALVFLVISCPCALVISIPLSFFGGIGGASRKGILIKGGNYLEALNDVKTVVFDKTGTLTKGVFKVTGINPNKGFSNKEVLELAAEAESYSDHPIAVSVLKAYGKEIDKSMIESYYEMPGLGVKCTIRGKEVMAGNDKLMENEKIEYPKNDIKGTVVHLAVDRIYAGNIVISDEIKESSEAAVKALKEIGIKEITMLTGDNKQIGYEVAGRLGINEVYAELLPDQKVNMLEMLKNRGSIHSKIAFVGDGINDAPVLALADVGIAMGGLGSDAAIEAADVVIMNDDPSKISDAVKIAKKTKKIVWENIILSLSVKFAVLVLGAFGAATMWEAVFADVGVALIAVMNSIRAINTKKL